MPVDELDRLLNEESGLRALGELDAPLDGDGPRGIDALAFSGGVGENRSDVREAVADRLRLPRRLRGRGALLDQYFAAPFRVLSADAVPRPAADPVCMATRPLRIMVGYDGSDSAVRALDAAAELFGYGSTLSVVTVNANGDGAATTAAARAQLHRRHIEARYHEASGEPADELVEKADWLEADLIVIGRRNGDRGRAFPGSVTSRVIQHASCDVLVVH